MEKELNILDIPDNTNYWLVRAGKGEEYDDFKKSGIIGLRYDKLTLDEINLINSRPANIQEYTTYTNKNGKIIKRKRSESAIEKDKEKFYKEIYKDRLSHYYSFSKNSIAQIAARIENFIKKMKIGDVVIVPYASSRKFLIGVIISDTYEISLEEQEKLEIKAQKEYEYKLKNNKTKQRKHKVSISRKRRNVKWINEVDKSDLSPKLFYTITMHQSIINISELSNYIDRHMSTLYIKNNKLHLPLKISKKEAITSELWEKLFRLINSLKKENEILDVKANVESPGWIEISQKIQECIGVILPSLCLIFGEVDIKGIKIKGIVPQLKERKLKEEELRSKKIENDYKEEELRSKKIENDYKEEELRSKLAILNEELERKKLENSKLKEELKELEISVTNQTIENEDQA